MRIFILEDSKNRIATFRSKLGMHDLTVAETATEAIRILENDQAFDLMFLDHDLGGGEMMSCEDKNTGSEVVRWMMPNQKTYCPVIIHSLNGPAAMDMLSKLESVALECYCIPFTQLVTKLDDPGFITQ